MRRDLAAIAGAIVVGAAWGFAIAQSSPALEGQLVGEGRWLAAAWLAGAAARRPAACVIAAVALVLALQGTLDLAHWAGVERSARDAGLPARDARFVASIYDGNEWLWPRTLLGALIAGGGAAMWRSGNRLGAGVLAGALAAEAVAGQTDAVPVVLAVAGVAVLAAVARTRRLAAPAIALALVPVAIVWVGIHVSGDLVIGPEPEIAVIR